MSVRKLIEGATGLILKTLQTNLPAALDALSAEFTDGVDLKNVQSYFTYPKVQGYNLPCIFVIADSMDFKVDTNKSNFINALDSFKISVVVDGVDEDILTRRAFRYQSALHSVLDQTTMTSSDSLLVLKCSVFKASFSDVWSRKETTGDGGQFRKEVVLECGISHFENF